MFNEAFTVNQSGWITIALLVAVVLIPLAGWFGIQIGRLQESDRQKKEMRNEA